MKEQGESDGRVRGRNMEMPLRHGEREGEEQSASECVSQPALDTTGRVALTAACQSLGRGSSM